MGWVKERNLETSSAKCGSKRAREETDEDEDIDEELTDEVYYKYVECTAGGSDKFWAIRVEGTSSVTLFGKRGSKGTKAVKEHPTPAAARTYSDDLFEAKIKKGYHPAKPPASSAAAELAASLKATIGKPIADVEKEVPYLECKTGAHPSSKGTSGSRTVSASLHTSILCSIFSACHEHIREMLPVLEIQFQ